jgi:allantoin racemase
MAEPRGRILIINPNSNEDVTAGLIDAVVPLQFAGGPELECHTLAEGPYGIESQAHIDAVVLPLRKLVAGRTDVDAFVIACYADPGLAACREATAKPVFGIHECGILSALSRGDRFGVLAISQTSIHRHARYLRQLGLLERLAGEYPLNMSVAETASGEKTFAQIMQAGTALRDESHANVLVLGCAGMAKYRRPLEAVLGIPVIDPPSRPSPWRLVPYKSHRCYL